MNQILTWHTLGSDGNQYSIGPAYYLNADYEPFAVRIYAEVAPDVEDAQFNIYVGGVTIFPDRATHTYHPQGGISVRAAAKTYIALSKDRNSEDFSDDFAEDVLVSDSWVTCNLIKDGGGKNFTVQLEIAPVE